MVTQYESFQQSAKRKAEKLSDLQTAIGVFVKNYAERIVAPEGTVFCCLLQDGVYAPVSPTDLRRGEAGWIYFWLCVQVDTKEVPNGLYGVKIGMNNLSGFVVVNVYDGIENKGGPTKLDAGGEVTLYDQISMQLKLLITQ